MNQPRVRQRHPATGSKDDLDGLAALLVPLTVAMDSIRLWSEESEESDGHKREEKSEETADRGSVSPRTVGG